jgi:hypothetical protein
VAEHLIFRDAEERQYWLSEYGRYLDGRTQLSLNAAIQARLWADDAVRAYRERVADSPAPPINADIVHKMASACFDCSQGVITGTTNPSGDPLAIAEETRDRTIQLYNKVVEIYGDEAEHMGGAYGDAFDVIECALYELGLAYKCLGAANHEDGMEGALADLSTTAVDQLLRRLNAVERERGQLQTRLEALINEVGAAASLLDSTKILIERKEIDRAGELLGLALDAARGES